MHALLLLTVICIFVPFSPTMPGDNLDPSWVFGMNQAVAQGLAFGREIVFTFGPYASVYTRAYHPATDHLMMAGSLYLALSYGLAIYLLARNSKAYLLVALWAVLAGLALSRDALMLSYPLLVGVVCSLSVRPNESSGWRGGLALTATLFLPFGLLSLIKGTALILCVAVAIIAFALCVAHRKFGQAVIVLVSPIVSMVFFWAASGQSALDLPAYFVSMAPVVSGYAGAMSLSGSRLEIAVYSAAALVLLAAVLRGDRASVKPRVLIFLLFAVYLFLSFKGGFVRHGHEMISAEAILVAALFYTIAFPSRWALLVLLVCTAAWIYIDSHYKKTSAARVYENIESTYHSAWIGIGNRLSEPAFLEAEFDRALDRLRDKASLPLFDGTVDIYSFNQSYLIASGNAWNPRPVFQSYSAYTPSLAEANRNHLLGENAPDHVVFRVETIDGRIPSIDDGASWPVLLTHYQPGVLENDFLYLHRRPLPAKALEAPLLRRGAYRFGETVPVPTRGTLIVAEIFAKPSMLGRFVNLLFRPSQLQITLNLENGETKTFRFVAGMAETGFLLSPLIENTAEYALLYGAPGYLSDKRVKSFSVAPQGWHGQWNADYEVRLRKVMLPARWDVKKIIRFDAALDLSKKHGIAFAEKCDGNIDSINATSPPPARFSAGSLLNVQGWLAKTVEQGEVAKSVLLVLSDNKGNRIFFRTRRTPRPDVAEYFQKPALDAAGYASTVDVSMIRGDRTLGLAFEEGDQIKICPQFKIPGSFNGVPSHE